jgi:muramidase (phage lysozyme)
MSAAVAYNPNDPSQRAFLSALALGETGGAANAASLGFGGTDLASAPTDQYGFPQWSGQGSTHAAGIFQFQPGTWDKVAADHGLDFSHPQDQAAGAWYLAQQADPNLADDLASGNFKGIQAQLAGIWPSVTGNAAAPQGLAGSLATGAGAPVPGPANAAATSTGEVPGDASGTGFFATLENWFLRGGLILVGVLVVLVALYFILSREGIIPSFGTVAKTAAAAA